MKDDLNTFCYIQEQTSFEDDYNGKFGYQVHDKGNRFYVTFEAVLQSFGDENRNHRIYEADNIMDRINNDEYIQTMLKNNEWLGEADHPAPQMQGEELTMQRIANPDITKTSHYIRSPRLEGNLLVANIQTDSATANGMNMAIKIVDGKIVPCFSARVLGSLNRKNGKPVVFVRKLITYDWVLYPSHKYAQARINQPLQESVDTAAELASTKIIKWPELAQMAAQNDEAADFICESFGLTKNDIVGVTESGNSVVMTEGSNVYIQPLSDKNIRKRTQSMLKDWINK